MKEVCLFEFIHSKSILYRLNPAIKLVFLFIFCITLALLPFGFLWIPFAVLIPLLLSSPSAVRFQLAALWKIYIFFLVTGLIRYLTSGIFSEGAALAMRMLGMTYSGLLFYTSTRLSNLRRNLPKTRLTEVSVMAIAVLPIIFRTISEQSEAGYSRCFRPGKNPFRTIKISSVPLMITMFLKTDEMADSWYSRGYNPGMGKKYRQ